MTNSRGTAMKFIEDLFEVYIPNAMFRIYMFFHPKKESELNEFIKHMEFVLTEGKRASQNEENK
jgi:hypothetical protein